jgi:hypothetical protein
MSFGSSRTFKVFKGLQGFFKGLQGLQNFENESKLID